MKKPIRCSLLALLIFLTLASVYAALAKLFGVQMISLGLIALSVIAVLGVTIRVFFFDR